MCFYLVVTIAAIESIGLSIANNLIVESRPNCVLNAAERICIAKSISCPILLQIDNRPLA